MERKSLGNAVRIRKESSIEKPIINSDFLLSSPIKKEKNSFLKSPNFSDTKKNRKTMGTALRIKTPSKKADQCENQIANDSYKSRSSSGLYEHSKENIENGKFSLESFEQSQSLNNIEYKRDWNIEDFTLGKPLGKGKFGNVYSAKQKASNFPVALKVLFKNQLKSQQSLNLLRREVEIQCRMNHQNIVHLHG
jgi:hypothetical protein